MHCPCGVRAGRHFSHKHGPKAMQRCTMAAKSEARMSDDERVSTVKRLLLDYVKSSLTFDTRSRSALICSPSQLASCQRSQLRSRHGRSLRPMMAHQQLRQLPTNGVEFWRGYVARARQRHVVVELDAPGSRRHHHHAVGEQDRFLDRMRNEDDG